MKEWLKEYKIFVSVVCLVLFLAGYYFFSPSASQPIPEHEKIPAESSSFEDEASKITPKKMNEQKMMVDMKGAIKHPGVYEANEGERVIDLIEKAGGLSENADESKVNLAMHVVDEMVLYVPQIGEVTEETQNFTQQDTQDDKVNINKADAGELETLPGIGPSKSAAIIEYRTTTGPFKSIEDIQSISGIGEKTFEKLKDKISVD